MNKELSPKQRADLLAALKARFDANQARHPGLVWAKVRARLRPSRTSCGRSRKWNPPAANRMWSGTIRSPANSCSWIARRRVRPAAAACYDREGWLSRKEARPKSTAIDLAAEMGVALLTEVEYFALQQLGEFDLKTSSWIATPPNIREPGGALYCERRYGRVFVGHNGAQSYYAVRGFRGSLTI